MNKKRKPLELYVHIPFCIRKCAYCDFVSGPGTKAMQKEYEEALLAEIDAAEETAESEVISAFFGGGTPSAVDAGMLARVMEKLRSKYVFSEDAEITLEANPGTLDAEKLKCYRKSGFNRISIGCQSVHDEELKRLGRIHTFAEFQESFALARDAGFANINVDLMSGLPEQSEEKWEESLRTIAELSPEHISAYSLIVEPGTPFAEQKLDLPDEDTEEDAYREEPVYGEGPVMQKAEAVAGEAAMTQGTETAAENGTASVTTQGTSGKQDEKYESVEQTAQSQSVSPQGPHPLTVIVNHSPITMQGKASYVFVDVFDYIDFDLGSSASAGRSIVTNLNGRPAQFMEPLKEGDVIEIYWKSMH